MGVELPTGGDQSTGGEGEEEADREQFFGSASQNLGKFTEKRKNWFWVGGGVRRREENAEMSNKLIN